MSEVIKQNIRGGRRVARSPHPLRSHKRIVIVEQEEVQFDINDLKQDLPFKWRVQSYSKAKPQATCVPYVDSRQIQDLLDSVCGAENWQTDYYTVGEVVYCKIGIKIGGEWVWKSDCGSKSNVEADKGAASDAFKRAAVKWGCARQLYSMRMYNIKANKKKEAGDKPFHLYCLDSKGNKLPDWAITDFINDKRGATAAVPAADPDAKGEEVSAEGKKFNAWLAKYPAKNVVKGMLWAGINKADATLAEYKKHGGAMVSRAQYAVVCNLVLLSTFDDMVINECLNGFDYKSIADGGIAQMIKDKTVEKAVGECKSIATDKIRENEA